MANEGSYLGTRSVELLAAAAPGLPVTERTDPWHGTHARVDLTGARSVQFAYLFPTTAARLALALYPADTLGQARVLYRDPSRVERLLALRGDGWRVEPNFHFGFIEKGLTWSRSSASTDAYAQYWMERIGTLRAFRRDDWSNELAELIRAGIFDPTDVAQFDRDFTNTKRQDASPRPGFRLTMSWPLTDALRVGFPTTLRTRLCDALNALGEQRASAAVTG